MYKRVYEQFAGVAVDQCSGDLLRTGNWLRGNEHIGVWDHHPKNDSCLAFYQDVKDEDDKDRGDGLLEASTTTTLSNNAAIDQQQRQKHLNRNRLIVDDNSSNAKNDNDIDIEFVMMPNVVVGAGRLGFFACNEDCALGRTKEYYRFRNYLFRNILSLEDDTDAVEGNSNDENKNVIETTNNETRSNNKNNNSAKAGYILFSMSFKTSRPEKVYNFKDEIKESINRYGNDTVKIVDLSTLSVKDQALLLDETAVLVTNHGGVGSASIFLPFGSSALVFWHGGYRMDHNWYESVGYFRTVWVGVEERPFLNRTMSIIDDQFEKTRIEWSREQQHGRRQH